ncbi:hypothetical protein K458DRAFT_456773 [Lentithecium fluviatile CBS 122367]|uniref:Uncharacterized protein n=1 Tax=Lentithecium fluviatile CBS 122367 TaxID=1168545 RepID=A0A6G1IUZ9_9PLEO|nr:hypothetical protein K458DRAFT_456773 [Lentithecium fluviatile CBS 122367]
MPPKWSRRCSNEENVALTRSIDFSVGPEADWVENLLLVSSRKGLLADGGCRSSPGTEAVKETLGQGDHCGGNGGIHSASFTATTPNQPAHRLCAPSKCGARWQGAHSRQRSDSLFKLKEEATAQRQLAKGTPPLARTVQAIHEAMTRVPCAHHARMLFLFASLSKRSGEHLPHRSNDYAASCTARKKQYMPMHLYKLVLCSLQSPTHPTTSSPSPVNISPPSVRRMARNILSPAQRQWNVSNAAAPSASFYQAQMRCRHTHALCRSWVWFGYQ